MDDFLDFGGDFDGGFANQGDLVAVAKSLQNKTINMSIYEKELQELKEWDSVENTVSDPLTGLPFILTAGHGYLVVPKSDKRASVAKKICEFGFVGKHAIYLEEDCEYGEFIRKTTNS